MNYDDALAEAARWWGTAFAAVPWGFTEVLGRWYALATLGVQPLPKDFTDPGGNAGVLLRLEDKVWGMYTSKTAQVFDPSKWGYVPSDLQAELVPRLRAYAAEYPLSTTARLVATFPPDDPAQT